MDVAGSLRVALADTWAFYFTSHSFHWNVTGPQFPQYHEFFGKLYEDASDAVDGLAEQLRALDELAPSSLAEIDATSGITFLPAPPDAAGMVTKLLLDNQIVLESLGAAQEAAESARQVGLANFLQDRINTHKKHNWMLTASLQERPNRRLVLYDAGRRI